MTPNGPFPAAYIAVTVNSPTIGRSAPSYTGPDGMYYLNIPPGSYSLEVWANEKLILLTVPILAGCPFTDIPPLTLPPGA
jgi:hypothetical protein